MTINRIITAVREAASREDIASELSNYTKPLIAEASQTMYGRNMPLSWTKAKMISIIMGYESEARGTANFIAPQQEIGNTEPEPLMGFNRYSPEHLLHIKEKFLRSDRYTGELFMNYFYEMFGRKVRVTGGRQAPKGTTGVCFYMGGIHHDKLRDFNGVNTDRDCRVGIKAADGQVYWTSLKNIELANMKSDKKAQTEYERIVCDLQRQGVIPPRDFTNLTTFEIIKKCSFEILKQLNVHECLGVSEIDDAKDAKELEDFYRMDVEQEIHIRREKIRDAMVRGTLSSLEVNGGAITSEWLTQAKRISSRMREWERLSQIFQR